jgi:hypothetical protein
MSTLRPPGVHPALIVPPYTMSEGRLTRDIAIRQPGMFWRRSHSREGPGGTQQTGKQECCGYYAAAVPSVTDLSPCHSRVCRYSHRTTAPA